MKLKAKILTLVLVLATLFSIIGVFAIPASAANTQTIYLNAGGSSLWDQSNAWFMAHAWDSKGNNVDVKMDEVTDGVYACTISAEMNQIIFIRKNHSNQNLDWSDVWNQTADLTIPTTGENYYTITGWGSSDGTWSSHYYTVAGSGSHLGTSWDPENTDNDMTLSNGEYTKTYSNVSAGDYELKCVYNHAWATSYGSSSGGNYKYTVVHDNSTVTVTFNPTTNGVSTKIEHICSDSSTDSDHLCDYGCGNTNALNDCTGGTATCTAQAVCTVCGESYGELADHTWSDTLSKDVNGHWYACNNNSCTAMSLDGSNVSEAKGEHEYTDGICATCTYECLHDSWTDGICDTCEYECSHTSYTDGICDTCNEVCSHTYDDGICSACGLKDPNYVPITEARVEFILGDNGDANHSDGSSNTAYMETAEEYELQISLGQNMYTGAFDAKGNSCIKLGTSSKAGSFSIVQIPENVTSVIICVAKYKSSSQATVTVNDINFVLTNASDDGLYDEIVVDTTSTKTIKFSVTSGYRAMVNSITYVISNSTCEHTTTEPIGEAEAATCTEVGITAGEKCADCGKIITKQETIDAIGHNYIDGVCSACGEKEPEIAGRYYIATIRSTGNYFYMTSDLGTASTKRYQAVDSELTTLPELISCGDYKAGYVFVIIDNDDGTYSIQAEGIEGDNYLGWTSGNSGILVAETKAIKFTIKSGSNGTFNIYFTTEKETRYLSLNGTSGNNYFAFYASTQKQDLSLIPVEAHEYKSEQTADPTCTGTGVKTYTCACGDTYTEDIDAKGHVFGDIIPAVASTCTTGGNDAYKQCSTCSKYFAADAEINSTDAKDSISAFDTAVAAHEFNDTNTYLNDKCANCDTYRKYIFLTPNSNWTQANARFAAYFYDSNGSYTWVNMTDLDSDYVYEVRVPDGGYTGVIFCRMNPSSTENGWEKDTQIWNQTADLTVPTDCTALYTVAAGAWSKGDGVWSEFHYDNDTDGDHNCNACGATIGDHNYVYGEYTEDGHNKSCNCGDTIKSEDHSYKTTVTQPTCTEGGYTTYTCDCGYSYTGNETEAGGHGYICEVVDAKYFKSEATCQSGTTYYKSCTCGEFEATDTAPTFTYGDAVNHVFTEDGCKWCELSTLYLKPGDWSSGSARIEIYFFNDEDNAWVTMVDDNYDGVLEATIPVGTWNGLIFVRMDPAKEEGTFDSAWNQTVDVVLDPTNSCFVFDNYWDGATEDGKNKGTGHWEEFVPTITTPTFSIAGTIHSGEWDELNSVQMTLNSDGLYEYTFTGIANGDYQFKVLANNAWTCSWGAATESGNVEIAVEYGNSTVVVTFNETTKEIKYTITHIHTGTMAAKVPATCTSTGTKAHLACSVCGKNYDADGNEIENLTIAKLDHTGTMAEEISATCTSAGTKAHLACSVCNKNYDADGNEIADLTIAKLDHTYNQQVVTDTYKASGATCTAAATYYYSCSCGKKGTETFEPGTALGHDHSGADFYRAEDNVLYIVDGCSRCDYEIKTEVAKGVVEVSTENAIREALKAGYSVKLTADIELTERGLYLTNTSGETITLTINLNGFNLVNRNGAIESVKNEGYYNVDVLVVSGKYDITISASGNSDVGSMISGAADNLNNYYTYAVLSVLDGAKVTIESGMYISMGCGDVIYATRGGEVVIKSGWYEAKYDYEGSYYVLDINEGESDENYGKITVYGGTFVNFDPANHSNDKANGVNYTNKLAEGYHSLKSGNNYAVSAHTYVSVVTAPTCTEQGYTTHTCSGCGVSYVDTYVDALDHTKGETVVENNVDPKCETAGSYDNVVYCTVCDKELSRETVTVKALDHTKGETVVENNVDPKCETAGSYDNVVYCTVCDKELSRETVTVGALGHTDGETVVENNVAPDCENTGSYDNVVYCTVCGDEVSRQTVTVTATGHTDADAVVENKTDSTCYAEGSYEEVIYCSVCGDELSRTEKTIEKKEHTPANAVEENRNEATCSDDGSYQIVVYCSVAECKHEISRETVTVAAFGHKDEDKNHECDNGCDVKQGTHADAGKDHVCDYGCSVAIGTCEDADNDHDCDYGCSKVYGEHKDENTDHACDYGCSESIGTCEDADKDHDCDYGCSKYYGEHKDENTDHVCDYGCSVAIGTCADSTTDKDHVCDYGCGKVLEECNKDVTIPKVEPSCAPGLEEGKKCSVCDAVTVPQEVIAATGEHVFNSEKCENCDTYATTKVGDKYYVTLQEAVDVGGEITLLSNVALTETIVIKKSVSINTGDYSISSTAKTIFRISESNITVEIGGELAINVMAAYARTGSSTQTILTIDDVTNVTVILSAEFTLGENDIISGDIGEGVVIYVNNVEGYSELLAQNGYATTVVAEGETYAGMLQIIEKMPYYIGANGNWYLEGVDTGVKAEGDDGESIMVVDVKKTTVGLVDKYEITFSDNYVLELEITNARSIEKIELTKQEDLVCTYTIYYNDNTTDTFTVTNGEAGKDGREVEFQIGATHIQWRYKEDTDWKDLIAIEDITGKSGREVTFRVEGGYIEWQYVGDTNWNQLISLEAITGEKGDDGHQVEFQITTTHIQWKYDNETEWKNLIELAALKGEKGDDGHQVEFQITTTHIQWKYDNETEWKNLIELAALKGEKGDDGHQVEFQITTTHIQWKYDNETEWKNLIELAALKGDNGHQVEFNVSGTHIQWRYEGEDEWKNLLALDLIMGDKGDNGLPVEFRVEAGYIQWRYQGIEDEWKNLIQIDSLVGEQGKPGADGKPGEDGEDGETPEIGENGNWWIGGVDTGIPATGAEGEDGDVPYIGENGNWWIGDKDTGVAAQGKDGNDNNKVVVICIGIAALCIIVTIVAVSTKKFRRPWWILC